MAEREDAQDAALLIDWENLKFSLQQKTIRPNVSALRDAAEAFGRVVVARAYADWQDGYHTRDPANLYAAGIEPIYVPTRSYYESDNTEKRKNSVDVKLTADCIELCHNYESIGVYVLVTGDQDFLHVVNTLRPYGKRVIIVGVSWTTSARLAERVDQVIYYDREVDPVQEVTVEPEPSSAVEPGIKEGQERISWAAREVLKASNIPEDLEPAVESILASIVDIVTDFRRDRRQSLLLSTLGMELGKRTAPQTFSMVVKGRLKQFVAVLASQGLIKVDTQGLVDWLYLPDEEIPRTEEGPSNSPEDRAFEEEFVDLGVIERRQILDALRAARLQPGVEFLTFNRICEVISTTQVGHRSGFEARPFVNGMRQAQVLVPDSQQTGLDPASGGTYTFWSLKVNMLHPKVAEALD